jgi:hypothetical protein
MLESERIHTKKCDLKKRPSKSFAGIELTPTPMTATQTISYVNYIFFSLEFILHALIIATETKGASDRLSASKTYGNKTRRFLNNVSELVNRSI